MFEQLTGQFLIDQALGYWQFIIVWLIIFLGSSVILIPTFLRSTLNMNFVDIGILYYVYICTMTIFTTNSINIYAGINGLEVG